MDDIRKRVTKHGFKFFVTRGVDIESHYLDSNHIVALHPELTVEYVDNAISKATDACREKSVDRLIDHTMKSEQAPENGAYSKRYKELNSLYDSNKVRHRYGKKVLGKTSSIIQRKLKRNPELTRKSDYVRCQELVDIANEIW